MLINIAKFLTFFTVVILSACTHVVQTETTLKTTTDSGEKNFFEGWRHFSLPGKAATIYSFSQQDGRRALTAKAGTSASMMRRDLNIAATDITDLSFSWQVPQLIENADIAERDLDDSPVRIVLTFEGDRSKFSAKNAMLSELAQVMTGEPLPYATLMYVWCNKRPAESVVVNPRTDRIRSLVVESGKKNLRQWRDYKRNIRADFKKTYGEKPGKLLSIAVMTDSDNTKTQVSAAYGELVFTKN